MKRLKKWWVLIVVVLAITLVIGWKEKRCQSQTYQCRATYTAQLPSRLTVEQQASEQQAIATACEPNSYFCRLFSATNLPSVLLVLVGIGAFYIGMKTLWVIEKQTKTAIDSANAQIAIERAWITVDEASLLQKMGREWFIRPSVKNLGNTIARVRKISLGGQSLRREGRFPDVPSYSQSRRYHDFVLLSGQEFPIDEVLVLPTEWERVKDAQTGIFTMYIFGSVDYLDLANNERITRFVLVFGLDGPYRLIPYLQAPAAYYENK